MKEKNWKSISDKCKIPSNPTYYIEENPEKRTLTNYCDPFR